MKTADLGRVFRAIARISNAGAVRVLQWQDAHVGRPFQVIAVDSGLRRDPGGKCRSGAGATAGLSPLTGRPLLLRARPFHWRKICGFGAVGGTRVPGAVTVSENSPFFTPNPTPGATRRAPDDWAARWARRDQSLAIGVPDFRARSVDAFSGCVDTAVASKVWFRMR